MNVGDFIRDVSKILYRAHGYKVEIVEYEKTATAYECVLAVGKNGKHPWNEIIRAATEIKPLAEFDVVSPPESFEKETITFMPYKVELAISTFMLKNPAPDIAGHVAQELWSRFQHSIEDKRLRDIAADFGSHLYSHARDYLLRLSETGEITYQNYDFELAAYAGAPESARPELTQIEFNQHWAAIKTLAMNGLAKVDLMFDPLIMITRDGVRVAEILQEGKS